MNASTTAELVFYLGRIATVDGFVKGLPAA